MGTLVSCRGNDAPKGPRTRPPPLVAVAKVETRDVPVEVRAPVDLRPLAQIDVGSKLLGYLDGVLVDRGDRVKKGQPIALVRPSDLPDQLAAARGTLAQTQSAVALARANFERASQLAPQGIVSKQDLEQSKTALSSAEASQAAVQGQVAALGVRLGETRILSPVDGVVASRKLDPGALVGLPSGGTIVTVLRDETLRVFVAVNERDAGGLSIGQPVSVEVDALPGRKFEGKVVRVAPAFDPTTRTLDAEAHLDNAQHELRPGMYGRATIRVGLHPSASVLPAGAVQITERKAFVFLLRGDKVERREVEIGVDGGNWLEVKKGLAAGDEVVTAGLDVLSNGSAVRVARGIDPYTGASAAAPPGER
jgi:membrane fusion protein, multidrug efflux system